MKFTPKTEEEINADGLIPAGEYPFEITEATDQFSKAGNEMIVLRVIVFHGSGESIIYDYLMEAVAYKLHHAAAACGLLEQYNSGNLDAALFEYKTGRCKVAIQKDKSGNYPDRNVIRDYIVTKPGGSNPVDDEIPF